MSDSIIEEITKEQLKEGRDHFKVGDGVKVHVRVVEGGKERIQIFRRYCSCPQGWRDSRNLYGTSDCLGRWR